MIIGDTHVVRGKYDTVFVARRSLITGKLHTMAFAVDYTHLVNWLQARAIGERTTLVQDEFPHLNDEEREFLLTGITGQEWNTTFPPEDEDPAETESENG